MLLNSLNFYITVEGCNVCRAFQPRLEIRFSLVDDDDDDDDAPKVVVFLRILCKM